MFSGRLESYKGVYEVIGAAQRLIRDRELHDYQLSFRFVGDGGEKNRLLKLEKDTGLHSYVIHKQIPYEDMPGEYQHADIFVAPSKATPIWQEQYCTALLEAQACGLPIVTTDSGGIPENIGQAGILVPAADTNALVRALKKFILNPDLRIRYGSAARKRAVTIHDVHIGTKKLSDLYRLLLL